MKYQLQKHLVQLNNRNKNYHRSSINVRYLKLALYKVHDKIKKFNKHVIKSRMKDKIYNDIAIKIDNKHIIYGQHHYHVIAMLQNTLNKVQS